MKLVKKSKGFTLVELIVVIAIIGILAAVLIPNISGYVKTARKSSAEQEANAMYKEFLGTVDNETYFTLVEGNYIVFINGYCVVIENGALKETFINAENGYALALGGAVPLAELGNNYIYLSEHNQVYDANALPIASYSK